jgi:transcriptional regulator with XRE-family HTH domain
MHGIGAKIKKVRELRSFTQEHVAEKIAMTQAGYSKIEQGVVDVPYSRLEQIAKVLNVKVEDLVSFDEKAMITNQLNNHATITNGYVFSDKEVLEKLGNQYEARITSLENEITRLHSLLEKSLNK